MVMLYRTFIIFILLCGCKEQRLLPNNPTLNANIEEMPSTFRDHNEKMAWLALKQIGVTRSYDPSYVKLDYPMGDVPQETGVCADVVVRAFRKVGVDLQKELHEDMRDNFASYPQKWALEAPDRNIDHRRVPNLRRWFERKQKSLELSSEPRDFAAGDIVSWDLENGLVHIGIVAPQLSDSGVPLIIHNLGNGAELSDVLFLWKMSGHYRYF